MIPLPAKKYQIIYADPPWEYKNKRQGLINSRKVNGSANTRQGGLPYPSLSLNVISNLSVRDMSDSNCVLFLWVTMPYLEKSLSVIANWGFIYKTVGFVWLKTYKARNPKSLEYYMGSAYGINYYTKLNCELCLMALRGHLSIKSHKVSAQIISPREEHSQKPSETHRRIVELFGDLPRIELFARRKVEGWDCWGNEV